MASASLLDVWGWINDLPPITQWSSNTVSLCICTSKTPQPSMNLSIAKSPQSRNPYVTFSITVNFRTPISLWTSGAFHLKTKTQPSLDEDTITYLFFNIINGILRYGPRKKSSSSKLPLIRIGEDHKEIFNVAFLAFAFLICIYEAPQDLRGGCLNTLGVQLTSSSSREASKKLVRVLGTNLEERLIKSMNLALTNWMNELQASNHSSFKTPPLLFSYAFSAIGLWKVNFYSPVIAMVIEDPTTTTQDERLLFSMKYQQVEGVIQFAYKVTFRENWIDVVVNVDNIRCDVNPLAPKTLMNEQGYGSEEKHFPSRISLQLTPTLQTDVLSVSVSRSSDNPTHEVGLETSIEASFDPMSTNLGLSVAASENIVMTIKAWKFEQSVHGNSAILNWFLHDGVNGREVFSSKPSKLTLFSPRSWFRNRYSSSYRPFNKQGGVVFAGDEYGDRVWWKVSRGASGKTIEWELKCRIWLTYWPNKKKTSFSETRRLEFRELLHLPLANVA